MVQPPLQAVQSVLVSSEEKATPVERNFRGILAINTYAPARGGFCIIDPERELNKPTSPRRTRRSAETPVCDLSAEFKRADSATGSWSAGCRNSQRSG